MTNESRSIQKIETDFPTIPLKYGVERRTNKFDEVPEELPRISLDMVESWTGRVIENGGEGKQATTGLVEFQNQDVLFSKLRPYLAKGFVASHRGATSPEFLVLQPNNFDSRFLRYVLLSKETIDRVNSSTYGAKMPRASWDFIGDLKIPCPEEEKQSQIAEFLTYNVGRIDRLVEKKTQLCTLLEEKRNAFITERVTSGLGQDKKQDETKDSIFPHLPTHWDKVELKFIIDRIEQGWSPKCKDRPAEEGSWRVMKAGAANNGKFHPEENKALPKEKSPRPELTVEQGDIVMNRASGSPDLLGSVARVSKDHPKLILCDKMFRLHVREEVALPDFVYLALRTSPLRYQIKQVISGADGLANNIPQADAKNLILPLPPLEEQRSIVQSVQTQEKDIDELVQRLEEAIERLREKRQSLISKAVTGQIDLNDWRSAKEKEATL